MKNERQISVMSLTALRPELFRMVPKLAENNEEIHLTHQSKVVAILSPVPAPGPTRPEASGKTFDELLAGPEPGR